MDKILEVDVVKYERGDSATRRAMVDGMRRSLETGFVYARHDLPIELIDDAYAKLAAFFRLESEIKDRYTVVGSYGQVGYTGMQVETPVSVGVPDLKEMYNWSAELPEGHPLRRKFPHRYREQIFPDDVVPGIEASLRLLHNRIFGLQSRVLRIIATGLGVHENFFDGIVLPASAMTRALHYPDTSEHDPEGTHVWAGEHADIDLITALPRATARGLQVKTDDGWIDAVAPDGTAIINTGKMLEHLTNGVINRGVHRVVAAPDQVGDRYSVVQFCHPTAWTVLEPLGTCCTPERPQRYGSILTGDKHDEVLWEINLVEDARRVEATAS
jgi:isopenicillin N synthase-like dioxygenase